MLSDVDEKHHMFPGPKRILVAEQLVFMEACFFLHQREIPSIAGLCLSLFPRSRLLDPVQFSTYETNFLFFLAKAQVDLDGSEISAFCEDVFRVAYMLDKH